MVMLENQQLNLHCNNEANFGKQHEREREKRCKIKKKKETEICTTLPGKENIYTVDKKHKSARLYL
jgi:hypothetical protein